MKKTLKIIALPFILLLLYVIIFLFFEFFYILEPSQGKRIDLKNRKNSAILIIDVQNRLTFSNDSAKAAEYRVGPFLESIVTAIDKLKAVEPVYIRQEFPRNSFISFLFPTFPEEGDPDTEIVSSVYITGAKVFPKSKADSFTNPELQKFLEGIGAGTLYITGLAAEACVERTIKGALEKGYRVIVIKEAVLSMWGGLPDAALLEKYKSYGAEVVSLHDLK